MLKEIKFYLFVLFIVLESIPLTLYADPISFTTWEGPATIRVEEHDLDGDEINDDISISDYLNGVLNGEIGYYANESKYPNADARFRQAFIAQCIAARTKLREFVINNPGVDVPWRPEELQHFKYSSDYPALIDSVVSSAAVGTKVIQYSSSIIKYPEYFGKIGDYTLNSEEGSQHGYYIAYLRCSITHEKASLPGATGHGVGMSQIGALSMSEDGSDYETILNNFYHSAPPIVEYVKVVQGGSLQGTAAEGNITIAGGRLIYEGSWSDGAISRSLSKVSSTANGMGDLQVEIHFSENIKNTEAGDYKLTSANNPTGVIINRYDNRIDNSNDPPTKWFGSVGVSSLASLGDGIITVSINALHKYANTLLDSKPSSVALYLEDVANYQQGRDTLHQFTIDTTPPKVSSTVPIDGETGVAPNTTISVSFSEPMDTATETAFSLSPPDASLVNPTWSADG